MERAGLVPVLGLTWLVGACKLCVATYSQDGCLWFEECGEGKGKGDDMSDERIDDLATEKLSWFDEDDGYEFVDKLDRAPSWRSLSAYGLDGWDAGDWPLVVIGQTTTRLVKGWGLVERVEGDVTQWWFASEADLEEATDRLVAAYWRFNPERFGETITAVIAETVEGDLLPDRFRGRFSWGRQEAYKAELVVAADMRDAGDWKVVAS